GIGSSCSCLSGDDGRRNTPPRRRARLADRHAIILVRRFPCRRNEVPKRESCGNGSTAAPSPPRVAAIPGPVVGSSTRGTRFPARNDCVHDADSAASGRNRRSSFRVLASTTLQDFGGVVARIPEVAPARGGASGQEHEP